jgi:hypothetical protein
MVDFGIECVKRACKNSDKNNHNMENMNKSYHKAQTTYA